MSDGVDEIRMDGSQPSLPDALVARAIYRRGRLAVFDRLEPARAALLVVDLQNAWTEPGAPFETPVTRTIVPAVERLAAALRARGGTVVWLRQTAEAPPSPRYWSGYFDRHVAERFRAETVAALLPGAATHDVSKRFVVDDGDLVVDKYRFSPFVASTVDGRDIDFAALLRAREVAQVIVCGTATNVGVESTVRDAMMRDFDVFVPHDAVVAPYYDGHLAAMRSIVQLFADVRSADALIALMSEPPAAPPSGG